MPTQSNTKADVPLSYTFQPLNDVSITTDSTGILIIFINGLMLPQELWRPTVDLLKADLVDTKTPIRALTYDRYGQGSSRSSEREWKPEPHDIFSSVQELSEVAGQFVVEQYPHNASPKLLFVSHSIGVPLDRLYSERHPGVSAHLFLDSNIANSDFISIFPDLDAEDFDPTDLPEDSTVDDLRKLRDRTKMMFHPTVPNPEGLDRSNLRQLLPHADQPKLLASDGKPPFLTVVGHDPEAFAQEGFKLQGTPHGLNYQYMQPLWKKYNEGLLRLSESDKVKGVVIAKGAGHFVQRDNPRCVADEIKELVEKLVKAEEGRRK